MHSLMKMTQEQRDCFFRQIGLSLLIGKKPIPVPQYLKLKQGLLFQSTNTIYAVIVSKSLKDAYFYTRAIRLISRMHLLYQKQCIVFCLPYQLIVDEHVKWTMMAIPPLKKICKMN